MPSYNSATAARALGVDPKWLDNLLSHHEIDGVARACQGVPRRLTDRAVETIAVARDLMRTTGTPAAHAVALATGVLAAGDAVARGELITISVDRAALQSSVARALSHAVEVAPRPARGRPPRSRPPHPLD